MTPDAILNALGQRLAALTSCPPIVWPNKVTTPPARPYLTVQMAARDDIDPTIAGGDGYSEGRMVVVVVSDPDAYTTAADQLAARIKAHFPKALRTGGVTIRSSSVKGGYPTDTDWRIPVLIDWIA